jgi:hypothetical protein
MDTYSQGKNKYINTRNYSVKINSIIFRGRPGLRFSTKGGISSAVDDSGFDVSTEAGASSSTIFRGRPDLRFTTKGGISSAVDDSGFCISTKAGASSSTILRGRPRFRFSIKDVSFDTVDELQNVNLSATSPQSSSL